MPVPSFVSVEHNGVSSRLVVSLALLGALAGLFGLHSDAVAYTIVPDGNASDWNLNVPASPDTAHLYVDTSSRGTLVWADRGADERADLTFPARDTEADIRTFAVTADANALYFLVAMDSTVVGVRPVQVQIAIDRDRVPGSGSLHLAAFADTDVDSSAAWEYLIMTRFGSGASSPAVWDVTDVDVASAAARNAIGATQVVEIAVPWSDIGGVPTAPLRFSVASFHCDATDRTLDITASSNAIDVVTNYGDPTSLLNTWDEVSDQTLNYSLDLWFHLAPELEPISPVLISQFVYDTAAVGEEWMAIFNRSDVTLDLSGYHLGDEETAGGTEGMLTFPPGTALAAGQRLIVAQEQDAFFTTYGVFPDFEVTNTHPMVPEMLRDAIWGQGTVNLANGGDELLLLDPDYLLQDVVTFETGTYKTVTAHGGCARGQSLVRTPLRTDTDVCALDFAIAVTPTPGSGGNACLSGISPFAPMPAGTACDDGDPCTLGEVCDASGSCQPGTPENCTIDGDACTLDVCDPIFRGCHGPAPTTASCLFDANPCTDDRCDGRGACATSPMDCSGLDATCVLGVCNVTSGACETTLAAPGTSCSDGVACTELEQCDAAGACIGTAVDCGHLDGPCIIGACDVSDGSCVQDPVADTTPCDDGSLCTLDGTCQGGLCVSTDVDCSSLTDTCNVGVCDELDGTCAVAHVLAGTPCDDGDPCTQGEICQNGSCYGGSFSCGADEGTAELDAVDDTVPDTVTEEVVEDVAETSADTTAADTHVDVADPGTLADDPRATPDGCGCQLLAAGHWPRTTLPIGLCLGLVAVLWRRGRKRG